MKNTIRNCLLIIQPLINNATKPLYSLLSVDFSIIGFNVKFTLCTSKV